MSTKNVTVSFDPRVYELARASADAAGLSMSKWLARAARAATITEAGRRYAEADRAADPQERAALAEWDAMTGRSWDDAPTW